MLEPKISYLVSTYNSCHYLDRHLLDLQNQTMQDFEVVIVNCSEKDAEDWDIAENWVKKDSRVRHIKVDRRETYGESWLRGWKEARGILISNSNTDDFHAPEFGEIVWNTLEKDSLRSDRRTGFAYTGIAVIDINGKLLTAGNKPPFDYNQFSYECSAGPQVTWYNDLKNEVDMILLKERAKLLDSAFDYYLWLTFMSRGYFGLSIPGIYTIYTQRPDSIENSRYGKESTWQSLYSISEFFPEHFLPNGKLGKEYPEFADFNNLPTQDEWIKNRKL